ncbi:glycosyltransferase family 2 protein [Anaerophaga thermohalophila]|uniref:glycosyltransferase family 2 protein n=1 Tax=Anaerophaga thermohalophila TaxID=177400 RepID=UPI0002DD0CE4|nr:glycosyltransferase family 2 protein [Anaerophaga thermohalophila]
MSNKQPRVFTIIVHYQAPEECFQLVKGLQTITYPNHQIVVVDNHSAENNYSLLKEKISNFENTTVVQNPKNNGYGGGINYGIKQTLHLSPDFFHIINTDTEIVNPRYISDIIQSFSQTPDAALIGPAVYSDNSNIQNTIMPFISLSSIFLFKLQRHQQSFIEEEPQLLSVEVINGVCFIIKADAYFSINGFDEDFFMYGEEHDFCYRLEKAGFKRYFWSGGSIIHVHHNKFKTKEFTWREALIRANQILFLKKHRSNFEAFFTSCLFAVSYFLKRYSGFSFSDISFLKALKGLFNPKILNNSWQ